MGSVYNFSGKVKSYLHLSQENEKLTQRLAAIELQYIELQRQVAYAQADSTPQSFYVTDSITIPPSFTFCTAQVISSTINRLQNLAILNRGKVDGIEPQMGVISANGVAGIISSVGDNYSVMIPLINPDLKLSCKIKRTGFVGTLSWNLPGDTHLELTNLPRHASFNPGDTIVTSGFSSIFPPNIYIGTIENNSKLPDKIGPSSKEAEVIPGTDFARLQFVYIITSGFPIKNTVIDSIKGNNRLR